MEKDEDRERKEELTEEDYQELIIQMRRMNVRFQRLSNIPAGELTMLLTVSRLLLQQSSVIPSDIGDAMKLSRPAVSRMLHNLEKKGYIRMESKKEDHRYVMVAFTQKGEELIEEEMERCCKLLERVKERMGEEDMQKFLYYYNEFCTILAEEVLV